jgi:hypothetical protein
MRAPGVRALPFLESFLPMEHRIGGSEFRRIGVWPRDAAARHGRDARPPGTSVHKALSAQYSPC